jgi:hypothetical protein
MALLQYLGRSRRLVTRKIEALIGCGQVSWKGAPVGPTADRCVAAPAAVDGPTLPIGGQRPETADAVHRRRRER